MTAIGLSCCAKHQTRRRCSVSFLSEAAVLIIVGTSSIWREGVTGTTVLAVVIATRVADRTVGLSPDCLQSGPVQL